jgi:regulator of sigma E protease
MIFVGLLLFSLLVIVHELGHFIASRRNGVEVEEFGIGFPPRLFSRKFGKSKTLYSFNLIPLGGFVKPKGESDSDTRLGSFGAATYKNKVKILLAGVMMNVVAVYVIIFILAVTSLPVFLPDNQFTISSDEKIVRSEAVVALVEPNSPAERGGLRVGDALKSIDGQEVGGAENLRDLTTRKRGEEVEIVFSHEGQELSTKVMLASSEESGALGIVPLDLESRRYTWASPLVAAGLTVQIIGLTLQGIITLLIGIFSGGNEAVNQVTGPVGIFLLLKNAGEFGFSFIFMLIAIISASLAVFNALPIPALDGGRLALITYAKLTKKKLSEKLENTVHGIGFVILLILILIVSYRDVVRIF